MAIAYNSTNRTEHAYIDHPERMRLIEEYFGFTGIVVEILEKRKGQYARKGLTSAGIVVVRCLNEDKMITAYMPSEEQAKEICRKAGKKQVPPKLWKKIQKNLERHPELMFMAA